MDDQSVLIGVRPVAQNRSFVNHEVRTDSAVSAACETLIDQQHRCIEQRVLLRIQFAQTPVQGLSGSRQSLRRRHHLLRHCVIHVFSFSPFPGHQVDGGSH